MSSGIKSTTLYGGRGKRSNVVARVASRACRSAYEARQPDAAGLAGAHSGHRCDLQVFFGGISVPHPSRGVHRLRLLSQALEAVSLSLPALASDVFAFEWGRQIFDSALFWRSAHESWGAAISIFWTCIAALCASFVALVLVAGEEPRRLGLVLSRVFLAVLPAVLPAVLARLSALFVCSAAGDRLLLYPTLPCWGLFCPVPRAARFSLAPRLAAALSTGSQQVPLAVFAIIGIAYASLAYLLASFWFLESARAHEFRAERLASQVRWWPRLALATARLALLLARLLAPERDLPTVALQLAAACALLATFLRWPARPPARPPAWAARPARLALSDCTPPRMPCLTLEANAAAIGSCILSLATAALAAAGAARPRLWTPARFFPALVACLAGSAALGYASAYLRARRARSAGRPAGPAVAELSCRTLLWSAEVPRAKRAYPPLAAARPTHNVSLQSAHALGTLQQLERRKLGFLDVDVAFYRYALDRSRRERMVVRGEEGVDVHNALLLIRRHEIEAQVKSLAFWARLQSTDAGVLDELPARVASIERAKQRAEKLYRALLKEAPNSIRAHQARCVRDIAEKAERLQERRRSRTLDAADVARAIAGGRRARGRPAGAGATGGRGGGERGASGPEGQHSSPEAFPQPAPPPAPGAGLSATRRSSLPATMAIDGFPRQHWFPIGGQTPLPVTTSPSTSSPAVASPLGAVVSLDSPMAGGAAGRPRSRTRLRRSSSLVSFSPQPSAAPAPSPAVVVHAPTAAAARPPLQQQRRPSLVHRRPFPAPRDSPVALGLLAPRRPSAASSSASAPAAPTAASSVARARAPPPARAGTPGPGGDGAAAGGEEAASGDVETVGGLSSDIRSMAASPEWAHKRVLAERLTAANRRSFMVLYGALAVALLLLLASASVSYGLTREALATFAARVDAVFDANRRSIMCIGVQAHRMRLAAAPPVAGMPPFEFQEARTELARCAAALEASVERLFYERGGTDTVPARELWEAQLVVVTHLPPPIARTAERSVSLLAAVTGLVSAAKALLRRAESYFALPSEVLLEDPDSFFIVYNARPVAEAYGRLVTAFFDDTEASLRRMRAAAIAVLAACLATSVLAALLLLLPALRALLRRRRSVLALFLQARPRPRSARPAPPRPLARSLGALTWRRAAPPPPPDPEERPGGRGAGARAYESAETDEGDEEEEEEEDKEEGEVGGGGGDAASRRLSSSRYSLSEPETRDERSALLSHLVEVRLRSDRVKHRTNRAVGALLLRVAVGFAVFAAFPAAIFGACVAFVRQAAAQVVLARAALTVLYIPILVSLLAQRFANIIPVLYPGGLPEVQGLLSGAMAALDSKWTALRSDARCTPIRTPLSNSSFRAGRERVRLTMAATALLAPGIDPSLAVASGAVAAAVAAADRVAEGVEAVLEALRARTDGDVASAAALVSILFGVSVPLLAIIVALLILPGTRNLYRDLQGDAALLLMIPSEVASRVPVVRQFMEVGLPAASDVGALLARTQETNRSILEAAMDAIVVADEEGVIQSANPAAVAMFGYRPDEMAGLKVSALVKEPPATPAPVPPAGLLSPQRLPGLLRSAVSSRRESASTSTGAPYPRATLPYPTDEKSERLLGGVLPPDVAARLKAGEAPIADLLEDASLCFIDMVNFTRVSSGMSPQETVAMLSDVFSFFDRVNDRPEYRLDLIKFVGDAAFFFTTKPAGTMVAFALDILAEAPPVLRRYSPELALRVGINTGIVVGGVINTRKISWDIFGDAVNVAARMESTGVPGRVQVSLNTYEVPYPPFALGVSLSNLLYPSQRVKYRFVCEPRTVDVKGKGTLSAFLVVGRSPRAPSAAAAGALATPSPPVPQHEGEAGGPYPHGLSFARPVPRRAASGPPGPAAPPAFQWTPLPPMPPSPPCSSPSASPVPPPARDRDCERERAEGTEGPGPGAWIRTLAASPTLRPPAGDAPERKRSKDAEE
eukprot:tig00020538_g10327.t1